MNWNHDQWVVTLQLSTRWSVETGAPLSWNLVLWKALASGDCVWHLGVKFVTVLRADRCGTHGAGATPFCLVARFRLGNGDLRFVAHWPVDSALDLGSARKRATKRRTCGHVDWLPVGIVNTAVHQWTQAVSTSQKPNHRKNNPCKQLLTKYHAS